MNVKRLVKQNVFVYVSDYRDKVREVVRKRERGVAFFSPERNRW